MNRGIQVFCGYDNDDAGHLNANKMIQSHPEVIRMVPAGKDWNYDLR
jgi:DNA primase